jgi:hypothetical protein
MGLVRAFRTKGFSVVAMTDGRFELNLFDTRGVKEHVRANYACLEDATEAGKKFLTAEKWVDITDECVVESHTFKDYSYPVPVLKYKGYVLHGPHVKTVAGRVYRKDRWDVGQ